MTLKHPVSVVKPDFPPIESLDAPEICALEFYLYSGYYQKLRNMS